MHRMGQLKKSKLKYEKSKFFFTFLHPKNIIKI